MKQIVHDKDNSKIIQSIYQNDRMAFLKWHKGKCTTIETGIIELQPGVESETMALLWAEKGVITFPSGHSMDGHSDLLVDLHTFFKSKILIDDKYIWLMAAYTYYTWFYDSLTTAPYLFIVGDYGTAKTRILELLQLVCFNPVNLGTSVTNANIFRVQDMARGTLIIDEFEKNASSKNDDYAQILNNGYSYPGTVIRLESDGKKFTPKPFTVFGPKIIGARELPNDKALISRCFLIRTEHHTNDELIQSNIPLDLKDKDRADGEMLRNRMLGLRFAKSNKRPQLRKGIKFRTSRPRNVQLLTSILSVMPSQFQHRIVSILESLLIGSSAYQNSQIEMDVVAALDIILRNKYPDWKNMLPISISLTEIDTTIYKLAKRHYFNRELAVAARSMGLQTPRHKTGVMVKIVSASELSELIERYLGVLDAV